MDAFIFIAYSFVTFLILVAGALFWYFKNVDLNHEDLYEKGMGALQKRDYEKAKELFLMSLADKPEFKAAKYSLGLTFVKMKDTDSAKQCFEEILEAHPTDFESRYNLALVHFSTGDYAKAKECFEKILEIELKDFDTLFNLALTCQMQKSYEEAQELYAKALLENENDADCYFNLGIIAFEQKDYEKALALFEQADERCFNRTDILFSIVRCKDELCKYETEEEGKEIVHQYAKISKNPNLPLEFDVFWARAYAKTGQVDKTLEICNRALVSLPTDALAYRILGLIKLIKNELEEAKISLFRAIELDEQNPDGYNILSYVFLREENNIEYVTLKTKYKELIAENSAQTAQ